MLSRRKTGGMKPHLLEDEKPGAIQFILTKINVAPTVHVV